MSPATAVIKLLNSPLCNHWDFGATFSASRSLFCTSFSAAARCSKISRSRFLLVLSQFRVTTTHRASQLAISHVSDSRPLFLLFRVLIGFSSLAILDHVTDCQTHCRWLFVNCFVVHALNLFSLRLAEESSFQRS